MLAKAIAKVLLLELSICRPISRCASRCSQNTSVGAQRNGRLDVRQFFEDLLLEQAEILFWCNFNRVGLYFSEV